MPRSRSSSSSHEANKALARRVVEEVWNQGNLAVLDELFEPHARSTHADRHGQDARQMQLAVRLYRSLAPDLHVTVDQLLADGDAVMVRWTIRGTHSGTVQGVATADILGQRSGGSDLRILSTIHADGHRISFEGAMVFRITNAKIASVWLLLDEVDVLRQLHALPTAGPEN